MKKIAAGWLLAVSLLMPLLAAAQGAPPASEKRDAKDRDAYVAAYNEGLKRFNEACKTAGKSASPPVTKRVPGIRLDVAPGALSYEQGSIDRNWAFAGMPRERTGDKFIATFLDFTFGDSDLHSDFGGRTGMTVTMVGFPAVDMQQKDGTYLRYRLKGKSPSEGMVSEPVARERAFRHVVSVEPLEVAGGRQHWVSGSRIRVVDGETGQVMGEVRAVSFALPPDGVRAAQLDKRSWASSMSCPRYLDIQFAMTRMSLIGIVDPPRHSSGPPNPTSVSLEKAVEEGLLREAAWADVDAWRTALKAPLPTRAARSGQPSRSYVVLKSFALPAGLHGAHSADFFVPKGVPRPAGDPGHATIRDFNTMRCDGPDCDRHERPKLPPSGAESNKPWAHS